MRDRKVCESAQGGAPEMNVTIRTVPRVINWGARALYIGPALNLSPHRNAVAVLAIGPEAPFKVAIDASKATTGYCSCRTVIIPPNTLSHLIDMQGPMAFLYLDARSDDSKRLLAQAVSTESHGAFGLRCENEVIGCLRRLYLSEVSWPQARADMSTYLGFGGKRQVDPRVRRALDLLHANPSTRQPLADLAAHVGLSPSRFIHLFKEATGVPLRRYKLWLAMGAAMRSLAEGDNLTDAAMNGGFSSPAHFSASFREMFGLEPSRLLPNRVAERSRDAGR
jgi:AraC-like DNA-binding protein